MSLKNQSRDLLKSKDASITNPRLIVLGILLKQDVPLTIDKLLKLSRGKLAQSTLYRVINHLQRFGLVTNPENTMVVELKVEETSHHHHLFCKNCGRIIDIELGGELEKQIENEVMDIQEQYELSIDGHSLELIGLCDLCN